MSLTTCTAAAGPPDRERGPAGRTLLPTARRHRAAEQTSEQKNTEENAAGREAAAQEDPEQRRSRGGAGRWKERPNKPINKPAQRRLLRSEITTGPAAGDGRIYGTVSREEEGGGGGGGGGGVLES